VLRPLAAAALLLGSVVAASAGAGPLLAAAGDVTATSAVIWVRSVGAGEVSLEARPAPGGAAARQTLRVSPASDQTGKFVLAGLTPGTRYAWQVRAADRTAGGEFVTAPAADQAARVRLLWSGDLGGAGHCRRIDGGYRIFRAMTRRRPDFFLFVGDTIYADIPCRGADMVPGADFVARTLQGFRRRHRYQHEDPAVQAFLRGTSVYAIWDDHEVRNDFSGPTEPLMPAGRRAFLEYWPIRPRDDEPTRLYRKVRWGTLLEVFILDTRQYRSPNSEPDGPRKTMLGEAQRRWLVDGVSASSAVWKGVGASVSLSIPTGRRGRRDSWTNVGPFGLPAEDGTGFVVERDEILRQLRERGVKNLLFLVADVHHAEVARHEPSPGWAFHELIAGPLSASLGIPRPLDERLNPRSLFARGGINNFGEITFEPDGLTIRLSDEEGVVLFTHAIAPR